MTQLIRCRRCGSMIDSSRNFCPNCGEHVDDSQRQQAYGNQNYGGYKQPDPAQGWNNPGNGFFSPQFMSNDAFASCPTGPCRGVAGILAILLGSLGIHYFYLGKNMAGLVMLLATVLSCGWLAFLTGAISLAQGISFFFIDNRTFYYKYVATTDTFPLF